MNIISSHPAEVYVETELNQWLNHEQLEALQLRRLNALLQHAVERVPFHRRHLATHTGRAPELRSLADLAQLPVLTKADIQANLDAMVPAGANRAEWIKNATGGSTGEPLVFYRDQRAQLWVEAAKERFRRWMGCLNEDKLALIWGADRDFPPQIPPNEKWLNVFNCRETDIERFILELIQWKPRAIRGYAGSLHLVAQFIQQRGLPPVRPHAIEAAAETLTPEMRRDIEAAFGAPVFNFYGAREMSCIACEDHHRDGLLVADDIRLAEIIRDGSAAAPGEEGKLILTDLVNYAMPFIRYEVGDMAIAAAPRPAGTDCGFSRIQHVLGRTANTITAPDGRLVHGEFFTHLFYHRPGIRNFQVRQSECGDIEVSLVPDGSFQPATGEKIVALMREHLGAAARVAWKTVQGIPATKTGKRMFTVSEIPVRFGCNGNRAEPADVRSNEPRPFNPPVSAQRSSSSTNPRILFLADRPGWAFDINARGVAEALRDEFEFRIEYVQQQPDLNAWPHDLLVVMFWGEDYHHRFKLDPRRVIKQVSSHRWALEEQYGRLTPAQMAGRYLSDAATLIVPSRRLQETFAPFRPTFLAPKGITPAQFTCEQRPAGPLRVGWVGNRKDACKGLDDILLPATGRDFELVIAGGELEPRQMAGFYNSVDVLCVASTAEGDPRPLIEGMASGCFPVAVDVGFVPELVEHRRNGLIVARKAEAFQAALQWCRCNTEFVREAGRSNARRVREARSWSVVAPQWREAFNAALKLAGQTRQSNSRECGLSLNPSPPPAAEAVSRNSNLDPAEPAKLEWTPELLRRFWAYQARVNRTRYFAYQVGGNVLKGLREYFPPVARVLDYGAGLGFLTEKSLAEGFATTAADISPESVADIRARFTGRPRFDGAFTIDELLGRRERFQVIFVTEVVEHVYDRDLALILGDVRRLLADGGVAVFTTPNDEDLRNSTVYCPVCNHEFHRVQHVRNWSMNSLATRLQADGLEVVDTFTTDFSHLPLAKVRHAGLPKMPHLVCLAKLKNFPRG